jgi:predicted transcriptional regulator
LSDEDIYHYTLIGNYINEYAETLQMTPEQLQEHIDIYEQDHEVPEDLKDDLEELAQQIVDVIKQNRERDKTFRNIINDNFNNQEKSTDS